MKRYFYHIRESSPVRKKNRRITLYSQTKKGCFKTIDYADVSTASYCGDFGTAVELVDKISTSKKYDLIRLPQGKL